MKPGNLIRRLSGRGPRPEKDYAPSNEYRSSTSGTATPPLRSPADDGYFSSQHGPSASMTYSNGNPRNPTRHSSAPLPRPGNFHRRPTNLSEKAAAKGGNGENNVQISLEHGLDIVINCEVNQKDPAGITTPYRLLIPALWYEGEGDPNEIGYTKKSWIKRLGSVSVKNRRRSVLAKRQGQGNWGGSYSDDNESLSQSEGDSRDERHDFPHIPRTTGRDMRNQEHNIQQKHRVLTTDTDDEEQDFPQQMQNERRFSKDGRYGSPQGQGGWRRHASQERRPSKLDDMLGMAGPTENGHAGDRNGDGNGRLTRFENDVAPTSNGKLGRTTSGRGYGGIEAYKESRWRGLLRRKE